MKKVVFVCIHNSGRSKMAEAFFKQLAEGKAQASSAGTNPGNDVNPVVVEAMKEVGIDISDQKPQLLTMEMVEDADRMITMGCGADTEEVCPASFIETEDWELDDPHGQPIETVRLVRDDIRIRVIQLLKEMGID